MPFSNPATASATATATARINGYDYFYWPGISGEPFPPSLGAGFSYSAAGIRPAVKAATGGSPGTTSTWPILPRIGPADGSTLDTVAITFFLYWDSLAFFTQGTLIIGSGLSFEWRSDSYFRLTDTVTTINAYSAITAGSWHQVVVTVAPGGALTWTIDAVAQTGFTLTGAGASFDSNALRPSLQCFGNGSANAYLSGLRYDWTA